MHVYACILDITGFAQTIAANIIGNMCASVLQSTLGYMTRGLTLSWQRKLTDYISRHYFSSMTYYRLAFVDKRVADPEQVPLCVWMWAACGLCAGLSC
jgi:ABC-type uncharacterized transport system fused permease/ATPase subunit